MNSFDIIKTVRVTEKGTAQSELNKYTLVADKRATKIQIRQAVEELFKVKVVKVNYHECFAGKNSPSEENGPSGPGKNIRIGKKKAIS
jgi:ribosomal protein L23